MINLSFGRHGVIGTNRREFNLALLVLNKHLMEFFFVFKFFNRKVSSKSDIFSYFFSHSVKVEIVEFPVLWISYFLWCVRWS
jgi:hypothetical protein